MASQIDDYLKTGIGSVNSVILSNGTSSAWTSNTDGAPLQLDIGVGIHSDGSAPSNYKEEKELQCLLVKIASNILVNNTSRKK